ncbi:MAG: BTAD domain-containing putative transcriptional regulator [Pseudonocardiaceae bacterium]
MAQAEVRLALVPPDQSMQWRALGPVEAVVSGQLVDLGPPRQRALFGLLLSQVNRPMAVDSVIEELWSGAPPAAAMTSVRAYVSNLRRVLEPDRPPRAPATVLCTRAPGYLLSSQGVDFDVHRFTEYAAAGRAALTRADPAQAVREFDAALGLWRGQAYADVADAGWAVPEIARLEELRLSVFEARCEAQLQLGERHGAVAELEMHVRANPLREHGCGLLALALYRAGRQAEALGVLRVTRARLADDLGIDPGAALQRLEHDILTQDPALDWIPPRSPPSGPVTELAAPALLPSPAAELSADEVGIGREQRVVSTHVQGLSEVVGRQQELGALRAAFTDPARHGRPIWRVLTGLGGVGKTSLARAYAQCYQEHYELVWWVRAENPEAVPGEFRALLDILAPQYAEQTHDPIQAAHAVLANRTEPWLLIIDNIAEPETLRGLLPAAGIGDVLVTSRAGTWPDRRLVLPITPLAQTHAVELMISLSGDRDQATAAILTNELGGLPLALAQAGCYVAQSALDLAGYLALYRGRRAELHQQGHAPDYPDTVATTWQLAFDQLTPPARALLNLLAWYAPDIIPLDQLLTGSEHVDLTEPVTTLLRPVLVDELEQHRAITELISYGLLTRAGPRGSVTMHRLVQAVTADQLTAGDNHCPWVEAAAALLVAAYPLWPAPKVTITAWRSAQTHVRAVIEHLQPDQPISLNLRTMLIGWTGSTGDFVRARELAAAVVDDMTRVFGPDDPHTLVARRDLAYWIGHAGDIQGAREAAAVAVEDITRVLGADHRHTLFSRGGVIRWIALSGDFAQARELTAAYVEDLMRVFGPDDRYTLAARTYLARWTGEAGDVAQARELTAAVHEDLMRVLGPDDSHTLAARAYLAQWTGEAGDVALAQKLAAALAADDERILGPDHRHTLLARANLVRWTGEAGNIAQAQELAAAVHEDFVRVYGADHRYTLRTRDWLAPWTQRPLDS